MSIQLPAYMAKYGDLEAGQHLVRCCCLLPAATSMPCVVHAGRLLLPCLAPLPSDELGGGSVWPRRVCGMLLSNQLHMHTCWRR